MKGYHEGCCQRYCKNACPEPYKPDYYELLMSAVELVNSSQEVIEHLFFMEDYRCQLNTVCECLEEAIYLFGQLKEKLEVLLCDFDSDYFDCYINTFEYLLRSFIFTEYSKKLLEYLLTLDLCDDQQLRFFIESLRRVYNEVDSSVTGLTLSLDNYEGECA